MKWNQSLAWVVALGLVGLNACKAPAEKTAPAAQEGKPAAPAAAAVYTLKVTLEGIVGFVPEGGTADAPKQMWAVLANATDPANSPDGTSVDQHVAALRVKGKYLVDTSLPGAAGDLLFPILMNQETIDIGCGGSSGFKVTPNRGSLVPQIARFKPTLGTICKDCASNNTPANTDLLQGRLLMNAGDLEFINKITFNSHTVKWCFDDTGDFTCGRTEAQQDLVAQQAEWTQTDCPGTALTVTLTPFNGTARTFTFYPKSNGSGQEVDIEILNLRPIDVILKAQTKTPDQALHHFVWFYRMSSAAGGSGDFLFPHGREKLTKGGQPFCTLAEFKQF